LIDDLNDAFFIDYTIGEPITDSSQFDPDFGEIPLIDIGFNLQLFK